MTCRSVPVSRPSPSRAYTADGILQETQTQGTFPSGATGIHRVREDIPAEITIEPEATPEANA